MIDFLITCGGNSVEIPDIIPNLVSYIVLFIKIGIPIILVVLGMLDMGKAVIGKDEKEMKESQNRLIHRVIYAVLIFLISAIVTWIISLVSASSTKDDGIDKGTFQQCLDCFVNGTESKGCQTSAAGSD